MIKISCVIRMRSLEKFKVSFLKGMKKAPLEGFVSVVRCAPYVANAH